MKTNFFSLILGLTCTAAIASAQLDRAALTGAIRDASAGLVTNASVVVTFKDTGLSRKTVSSSSGVYQLSGLPIGKCSVEISMSGFRRVRIDDLQLSVGETRTLDVSLELATVQESVEVQDVGVALAENTAQFGDVTSASQLSKIPLNGRNWTSLMALTPGAVDPGNGSQNGVHFFASGGDDNNFRVDGVDATNIRNQAPKTRLQMSSDAIAEFKVSSSLFTAESGGTAGGQIEVVSKSGGNRLHGSVFEYFRNSELDARGPFDVNGRPPLRLNQFGATAGGPLRKNQTFAFLSYEGYFQRRGQTLIGAVPTLGFRDRALQTSPAIAPVIAIFPLPTSTTSNPDIAQWTGLGSQRQDEHVGLLRVDHRFNDHLTSYFRFTRNSSSASAPSGSIGLSAANYSKPVSGVVELLYALSPRATNEFRFGSNFQPNDSANDQRSPLAINVSGFASILSSNARVVHSLSETINDNFSVLRGRHILKAGIEIRRVIVNVYYSLDGTVAYASTTDFLNNKVNTIDGTLDNPHRTTPKTEYFGYVQDEWKLKANLTVNMGLRYEFYNVFTEKKNRSIAFDPAACGGLCPYGGVFGYPDKNNFAPRLSVAWSPRRLQGKTVLRFGSGIYYGDAQLGDQLLPTANDTSKFSLSAATTPGLKYPVIFDTSLTRPTSPFGQSLYRRNEVSQQWGAQIQQLLPWGITAQAGYMGSESYHLFNRTYFNVLDPVSKKRPLPAFDQIDYRTGDGVGNYHGLLLTAQRTSRSGLFVKANYAWSHATNDGSAGGGDGTFPQNVSCRSCEKASSQYDARHTFVSSIDYPLPFLRGRRLGGWEVSGIGTYRTGLPLTVTVSRSASAVPDGNSANQRPNVAPDVSVIPPGGQTTDQWINPAAFSVPATGTWGNAGRGIVRGPKLQQIDASLTKSTRLTERANLVFRAEAFNIFNHPQFGAPNLSISAGPNFGRITNLSNTTPIGTGTARSMQLALRLDF